MQRERERNGVVGFVEVGNVIAEGVLLTAVDESESERGSAAEHEQVTVDGSVQGGIGCEERLVVVD